MSFVLRVDPKKRAAGRFIGRVRDELVKAFVGLQQSEQMTQQQLADTLGVDRARISRALNGGENLTLRSVAELAWAMKRKIVFSLEKADSNESRLGHSDVLVQPKRSVVPKDADQLWGSIDQRSVRPLAQATAENV